MINLTDDAKGKKPSASRKGDSRRHIKATGRQHDTSANTSERGKTVAKEKEQSIKERIKQLEQEAQQLKQTRHDTLVGEIKERTDELSELGFDYDVTLMGSAVEEKPKGTGKGRPKGFKMTDEQKRNMAEGRRKAKEARAKAEREAQLKLETSTSA